MAELFKGKVRRVGTSLGVLIPADVVREEELKEGEEIELSILRRRNLDKLLRLMGTAKGAKPFVRDRTDRSEHGK